VLAWPFTAWNFLAGQNGFLTASLLGAALVLLVAAWLSALVNPPSVFWPGL